MSHTFYEIDDSGVTIRTAAEPDPPGPKIHGPKVGVHRDLTIEMHGPHYSAKTQLSVDEALGLAMMLLFACREHPGVRTLPKGGAQ
jgi:hypothetical protein